MIFPQTYQGKQITFAKRDDNGVLMVNATEMAKSFDTKPANWLRSEQAQRIIKAIAVSQKCDTADLVRVIQGGEQSRQGTWFHEDVALVFAQWLSPEFYIWCNDKIKELLQSGSTSYNVPKTYADALLIAYKQAKEIEEQQKIIEQQRPKVLFADAVETSQGSILIAELAKLLTQNGYTIGQNRLFAQLREEGYLCKYGEYYNQPTQKAQEMGLFEIRRTTISKPNGETFVRSTIKVTGKGQIYFINHFLNKVA